MTFMVCDCDLLIALHDMQHILVLNLTALIECYYYWLPGIGRSTIFLCM